MTVLLQKSTKFIYEIAEAYEEIKLSPENDCDLLLSLFYTELLHGFQYDQTTLLSLTIRRLYHTTLFLCLCH